MILRQRHACLSLPIGGEAFRLLLLGQYTLKGSPWLHQGRETERNAEQWSMLGIPPTCRVPRLSKTKLAFAPL